MSSEKKPADHDQPIFEAPSSSTSSSLEIPDHWRPEVQSCLEDKCLTNGARNEIVRTLVHLLFAKVSKPTRLQCEDLARKLIMKYPFIKDDLGNGYVSYSVLFMNFFIHEFYAAIMVR